MGIFIILPTPGLACLFTARSGGGVRQIFAEGILRICSRCYLVSTHNFFPKIARGGQAKICERYADLVGTKKADMQIFSMKNEKYFPVM